MLPSGYTAVLTAQNQDEFRAEVLRFTQAMGFETMAAMAVVERGVGGTDFISIHNAPDSYVNRALDVSVARRDPVMQHCKRQSVPIIWDQQTYVTCGLGDVWEEQAEHGYSTGIAMALHLPEGRHFVMGVDRDQPLPRDLNELQRLVADLQLFAVHAQDAAMRLLLPGTKPVDDQPALTPRELEALWWTMDGKTAWELGTILGITERTAVLHLQNAMRKLGCVNKHAAVLRALRLGLIH
jgi:DNA-binding CsgD family transcriptional regulator